MIFGPEADRFTATKDFFVRTVTLGALALVVLGFLLLAWAAPAVVFLPVVIAFFLSLALLRPWLLRHVPRGYRLDPRSLVIEAWYPETVEIPYRSITGARPIDLWLVNGLRLPPAGNSGLGGVYGAYRHPELGDYRLYGTRARGGVVLDTAGGNVVITPDERDRFLKELEERIRPPRANGAEAARSEP